MHFFNIKPSADEEHVFHLINHRLLGYTRLYGCIERKTWKLADANLQGATIPMSSYLNEALWPNQQAVDTFASAWLGALPDEVRQCRAELDSSIETLLTLRYIDDAG